MQLGKEKKGSETETDAKYSSRVGCRTDYSPRRQPNGRNQTQNFPRKKRRGKMGTKESGKREGFPKVQSILRNSRGVLRRRRGAEMRIYRSYKPPYFFVPPNFQELHFYFIALSFSQYQQKNLLEFLNQTMAGKYPDEIRSGRKDWTRQEMGPRSSLSQLQEVTFTFFLATR